MSRNTIGLRISYDRGRFERAAIDRMLVHLRTLLGSLASAPEKRVWELPLLPDEETRRLLVEWNETRALAATGADATVHQLFAEQAERTPAATALVAGSERLTYRELASRVYCLANHLVRLGVGPDVVVGLCLDRSADAVIGLLGILAAGGAYLPLDPAHPAQRLAQLRAEAGVRVVVTRRRRSRRPRRQEAAVAVEVDAGAAAIGKAESATRGRRAGAGPQHLAYVLFTSGSTGKPKGVAVEHRNLVSYLRGVGGRLALPEGASYAHVSTLAADLGNTVLFPPLCSGGVLHLIPEALTTDPDGLGAYFQREGVGLPEDRTLAPLGAALGGAPGAGAPAEAARARRGRASAPWALVERTWLRSRPGCASSTTTARRRRRWGWSPARSSWSQPPAGHRAGAAGAPAAQRATLRARRREGASCPSACPASSTWAALRRGARLPGVQPEPTRERLLLDPAPFPLPSPRRDEDAAARRHVPHRRSRALPGRRDRPVFLGRKLDDQVKIRGHRVELGEIEAALRACPGVAEAVVVVPDDLDEGERRLVAYVVPEVAPGELHRFLEQRLPEAMIPQSFTALAALPLTPNGKVDRRALAALEERREAAEKAEPRTPLPRTAVEEVIAGIWS